MQYRTFGRLDWKPSALGFGAMRLPVFEEDAGKIDEELATRMIRTAIDRGVNYVDTAWPYHKEQSEPLVGRALGNGYRDKVKLATKMPSWLIKTRDDFDVHLNEQLRRLQTDHIDFYLLHALNKTFWPNLRDLEVFDWAEQAIADGRIGHLGFSFHDDLPLFKEIVDAYDWTFCQIQYNYLDQQNQAGTKGLEYAAARDLGVIVMEPLRGGNLGQPEAPPAVAEIWDRAETRRTPVEWALRWVWNHPAVTVILSGMNVEAHIEENMAIAAAALPNSLTPAECDLVETAARKYKELMKVGCTGCGYCMPCPEGVMIPAVFEVYNKAHLFGNMEEGKFLYAIRLSGGISGTGPGFASSCVACGECLDKCPQGIEIPDFMAEIAEEMEDDQLENRLAMGKKMFTIEAK